MSQSKLFKFQPTREILVVLFSWVMVVAVLHTAFQVFTTKLVAANFITFGIVGILLCGIMLPVVWNTLIMKRSLGAIGITKHKLALSLILGVILTVAQYFLTLKNIEIPGLYEMIPLVTMALAVGLYENIFYRGWVQLRMEEYFGIIPAILLSGIIYTLYHIGYGMTASEMKILFIVGIVYSTIFRLTGNIFILYPLLTPTGALFTQLQEGLRLPFPATYGFADVILAIIVGLVIVNRISKKSSASIMPKVKQYFM